MATHVRILLTTAKTVLVRMVPRAPTQEITSRVLAQEDIKGTSVKFK